MNIPNQTNEFVIYNYDFKSQTIAMIYRGTSIPEEYKEYNHLWRLKDKQRGIQTIIIAVYLLIGLPIQKQSIHRIEP